jgi:acyl phosphate:glycerol-3-phosphate acyltransferase
MTDPGLTSLFTLASLAALALGYLLGTIPFGLILTKLGGTEDLRSIGSGNIGATNVLRTGRKGLAAATLLGDALKGTVAVVLAGSSLGPGPAVVAGLGAFLGHVYPVWLGFKGGKGVATYLGALLGIAWPAALAFAGAWLLTAWLSRFSSLSAFVAATVTPGALFALGRPLAAVVFLAMTALLFWTHRANIERLLSGRETRIGEKG